MPKFNYAETERTVDREPADATTKPVSRPDMVENSTAGYVFKLSPLKRLERFLILGSESPTYYASAKQLTMENCKCIKQCIKEYPTETLELLLDMSLKGRAPKQQPIIFALSMFYKYGAAEIKPKVVDAAVQILRTFTHLATFMNYVTQFHSVSNSVKRIIKKWYTEKDAKKVYYQVVKYAKREGWSHKDVLHLGHVKPHIPELATLMDYIFNKINDESLAKVFPQHQVDMDLRKATTANQVVNVITGTNAQWEQVPTQWLKEAKVWSALLPRMGMTALIRSLGRMGSTGIFDGMTEDVKYVCNALRNREFLKKGRIHPIQVLAAYSIYGRGHAERGNTSWSVSSPIVSALQDAYFMSFDNVEPTGKNFMIGVDTSGSMTMGTIAGIPGLSPIHAAACLASERVFAEPWCEVYSFSSKLVKIPLTSKDSLTESIRKIRMGHIASTNPSLLIQHAIKHKLPVDVFIMITDNEVNHGTHPFMELKKYRKITGRDAKLIVIGMTATEFSIADPKDGGMLDIVGFDTSAPSIIKNFITNGL